MNRQNDSSTLNTFKRKEEVGCLLIFSFIITVTHIPTHIRLCSNYSKQGHNFYRSARECFYFFTLFLNSSSSSIVVTFARASVNEFVNLLCPLSHITLDDDGYVSVVVKYNQGYNFRL